MFETREPVTEQETVPRTKRKQSFDQAEREHPDAGRIGINRVSSIESDGCHNPYGLSRKPIRISRF